MVPESEGTKRKEEEDMVEDRGAASNATEDRRNEGKGRRQKKRSYRLSKERTRWQAGTETRERVKKASGETKRRAEERKLKTMPERERTVTARRESEKAQAKQETRRK